MGGDPRRGPPRLARWLLSAFIPRDERDAVVGDLEESFHAMTGGGPPPRLWYWAQALAFMAIFAVQRVREVLGHAGAGAGVTANPHLEGMMETWMRDLRLGVRSLRRRPGFTALVVITLALGIGANTAIFSVIYGSLLRPLPYPDADRLVYLSDYWKKSGGWGSSQVYLNVQELREGSTLLEDLAAFNTINVNLATEENPQRVRAADVDPQFFRILGLPPVLGRDFQDADNRPGNERVAILGYDLWQETYGGDPGVVGSTIRLDSEPYTVLGVASQDVEILGKPRVFVPFGWAGREDLSRGTRNVNAIGRLAPGATVEAAGQELDALFAGITEAFPDSNEGWGVDARTFDTWILARGERSLFMLGAAALVVLLIALVNVANLVMVRAEARQREIAVRMAMGAGRGRLVPYFLSEGIVLSLAGGVVGSLLAWWGVKGLVALYGSGLPRGEDVRLSAPALALGLGLSLASGLLVGMVPAWRTDARNLQGELREGGRGVSRGVTRVRTTLVIFEFALAVVLVSGAGLLVNSFWRLSRVDLGLQEPEQVVSFGLSLPDVKYPDDASRTLFLQDVSAGIQRMGAVQAVGLTNRLPLYGGYNITNLTAVGETEPVAHFVELRYVTDGFFDAVGVPLLKGRRFGPDDYADSIPGVLVTQELAREIFPAGDAVGRRVDLNWFGEGGLEVLGVVADIRDRGITSDFPPGFYLPVGPGRTPGAAVFTVRAAGDPLALAPGIRDVVRDLDPEVPVHSVELLSHAFGRRLSSRRFAMSLLAMFAGLALLLGAVGIYGVMSYSVTQRTREMGVRIALGAYRGTVVRMVLRQGIVTAAVGVVLGIGGGLATGRVLESQLFGVTASDPLTYAGVAAALMAVALLASWIPARKASSVDPLEALRHE